MLGVSTSISYRLAGSEAPKDSYPPQVPLTTTTGKGTKKEWYKRRHLADRKLLTTCPTKSNWKRLQDAVYEGKTPSVIVIIQPAVSPPSRSRHQRQSLRAIA